MMEREPPGFARWLLLHGYRGTYRDSLDADLCEEYQCRRNRAWYWREVCLAILLDWTASVRERSVSVLDAALGAFAVIALGLATLTWAGAAKHAPPTHAPPCHERQGAPE